MSDTRTITLTKSTYIFLTNLLHALSQTGDGMEVEIDDKALTDTIVELSNVK
jgi:hypothetical protein